MNLSLGLYYLKFVAFKECCLAKILNLDTKAIAYLLFHTEEILDSVLIKKKKVRVLQSNRCYLVQGLSDKDLAGSYPLLCSLGDLEKRNI